MRQKRKILQDAEAEIVSMMQNMPPPPSEPTFESITPTISPDAVVDPIPSPEPVVNAQTEVPAVVPETETETQREDPVLPTAPAASSEPEHASAEEQFTTTASAVETVAPPAPVEVLETDPLSETASSETIAEEDCEDEDEESIEEELSSVPATRTHTEAPRPTDEL